MYAGSYDNGAGGSLVANRGSSVRTFTPSKPGDGLCAFAGNVLDAVASTLFKAKAVLLEGASVTSKHVHAFCDHIELLIRSGMNDAQTFRSSIHHGDGPALHDF